MKVFLRWLARWYRPRARKGTSVRYGIVLDKVTGEAERNGDAPRFDGSRDNEGMPLSAVGIRGSRRAPAAGSVGTMCDLSIGDRTGGPDITYIN